MFEDAFTIKGKTYIREYDKTKQKSVKRPTHYKDEYYIPDEYGKYKGFLDDISLTKVQGNAWKIHNAYGARKAPYVAIRDENPEYNKDPRIWHFDIETKVGNEFPKAEDANQEISCFQIFDTVENKVFLFSTFEFIYENDYKSDISINYEYMFYNTEIEMIKGFLDLFKTLDPFIVYAWGGDNFDFPYIFNRFKKYNQEKKLSNYGSVELKTTRYDNGQVVNNLKSTGHYFIDMLDVYKKFVFRNVQDYKLDTIAELEINQKKVDYSNYNTFRDFYHGNYKITGKETPKQQQSKIYKLKKALDSGKIPKHKIEQVQKYIKDKSKSEFLWYAIQDVIVLRGIHDRNEFTKLMISISETMGVTFKDVMGTLKPWSNYIANTIYSDKKILPPDQRKDKGEIVGGFVKDPISGKHPWVFSLDFTSLYPNIMRAYNMSPELFKEIQEFNDEEFKNLYSKVNHQNENKILELDENFWDKLHKKEKLYNCTVTFGGGIFSNDHEGFIPNLVGQIFNRRKKHKKLMLKYKDEALHASGAEKQKLLNLAQLEDVNQMTMKILINSLYGAIGNSNFVLFNEKMARSITAMGRWTIILTSNDVEKSIQNSFHTKEHIVLYNDTDSAYLNASPIVEYYKSKKVLSHENIVNLIDKFYKVVVNPIVQKSINKLAYYTNAFQPEVQGADREVIGTALFVTKKKYAMLVYDNEGVRYTENEPYIKVQGLEMIKGGTPEFAKKYLKEAIPVLLKKSEQEIRNWFETARMDFMNWDLEQIAKTQGVSKIEDSNWGKIINGRTVSVPFGSRTAVVSNKYITEHSIQDKYQLIKPGDKVKMLYLNEPNPLHSDAFAFLEGEFAEIFKEYIDYDTNFEKFFLASLEIMTTALGIDLNKNTEELEEW